MFSDCAGCYCAALATAGVVSLYRAVLIIKIIEKFLQSKFNDLRMCEDGIFHNERFVAIIDGVTSKGIIRWNHQSSGYHAKELILIGLSRLSGAETAAEAFEHLNSVLYKEYGEKTEYFQNHPEERLQATIVIYSVYHKEIWCFGDCQYMINEQIFTNEMKIDALLAEVRSVYLQLMLLEGKTMEELLACDPAQEIILPLLKRQFRFSNCNLEYGYSVLDGFCNHFKNLITHSVPEHSSVVLASDGYPILKPTLQLSEIELKSVMQNDPLCINQYKSTRGFTNGKKSLDDRAYIRFVT